MFIKLIRLGKDAELKTINGDKQVCNFSGAYDIGYGDNKKTQWVKCALWGDRGAKVVQHLTKGSQIVVTLDDLEVETYEGGASLKGKVVTFDFAGGNKQDAPAQQSAPQQPYQQAPAQLGYYFADGAEMTPEQANYYKQQGNLGWAKGTAPPAY